MGRGPSVSLLQGAPRRSECCRRLLPRRQASLLAPRRRLPHRALRHEDAPQRGRSRAVHPADSRRWHLARDRAAVPDRAQGLVGRGVRLRPGAVGVRLGGVARAPRGGARRPGVCHVW